MPAHFTIPDFLKHLPVDLRGYPIPYFVTVIDGKPDFRLVNIEKRTICIKYHKCGVCGRKLQKGLYYFVSGPLGAKNQVSTDPPMHKECAGFSLLACPHLHFEKAQRREKGLPEGVHDSPAMLINKPQTVCMVYADSFKIIPDPGLKGNIFFKYHAVKVAFYGYVDGVLVPTNKT